MYRILDFFHCLFSYSLASLMSNKIQGTNFNWSTIITFINFLRWSLSVLSRETPFLKIHLRTTFSYLNETLFLTSVCHVRLPCHSCYGFTSFPEWTVHVKIFAPVTPMAHHSLPFHLPPLQAYNFGLVHPEYVGLLLKVNIRFTFPFSDLPKLVLLTVLG